MGETFTTTINAFTNKAPMKEAEIQDNLEADDVIFYHSIRAELDLLKKKPKLQTIHAILDHSRSLR
ncbi:hypothetical protein DYU05_14645 [Mucilaginibacter terrenus]|uniref:Uncharacterized protein n=1 Tax=Mucilaginibacter terrenus TaxID=2482727 RepID=A0A3E2NR04_9SPHI|nr:hypothetical protein [Mucilaginibacter terrenus]RFZ83371.1 hypothetical protein DYU05_14645 [Mucilaginibacter terrenus]